MSRSPIAEKVAADIQKASWVRAMFEKGRKLKAEYGDDGVFDFSLGNPNANPPDQFYNSLRACAAERDPSLHRYMPNAGFEEPRSAVARFLSREYGLPFDGASVILTSGAAGAMNVTLRALLDPGDEVIVIAPYFQEYRFYIEHAQGRLVAVESRPDFQPDPRALESAIATRTRAVIINSPNNPTGVVYSQTACRELAAALQRHDKPERPIYLLCDDIYRRLVFDQPSCPAIAGLYARSIICSSFSKDLSIPGERIGYIAPHPLLPQRELFLSAATMLNRTLGFVNAPAFMQRVVARCADSLCGVALYRRNRDLLCDALQDYGYEITRPGGAFYAFPRTPIDDDVAFTEKLLARRVLCVPGRGFGRAGHMRVSYCVETRTIERALPEFAAAIREVRR
ncbi:MAG: pyridoxal phosphate-dependent aminotransferase [Phycisphaerae bacterium]